MCLRIKYSSVLSDAESWRCPESNRKYELTEALIWLLSSGPINCLSNSLLLWLNKSFLYILNLSSSPTKTSSPAKPTWNEFFFKKKTTKQKKFHWKLRIVKTEN